MKIYFSGSIRGGRNDVVIYAQIIELLQQYGTVLTEHIGNADLSAQGESLSAEEIFDRDSAWVRECDVIVAEVTQPSLGVGYEIGLADSLGKKIICLYRPGGEKLLSGMIRGNKKLVVHEYNEVVELEEFFKKSL